jgi:hypothetical protein
MHVHFVPLVHEEDTYGGHADEDEQRRNEQNRIYSFSEIVAFEYLFLIS